MIGWLLCKLGAHDSAPSGMPGVTRCVRCGKFQ